MFSYFAFNTIEFIIHIFVAYTVFIMGWLIYDSVSFEKKKNLQIGYRMSAIGYVVLALYLLIAYAYQSNELINRSFETLLVIGLLLISAGTYQQPTPTVYSKKNSFITLKSSSFGMSLFVILGLATIAALVLSFLNVSLVDLWFYYLEILQFALVLVIILLLFIKYFYGLQKEQKIKIWGFILFGCYFITLILNKFIFASDLRFLSLTEKFGTLWVIGNIFLLLGFLMIGKYAVSFIRFRLKPQLFLSFILTSLIIFFTVTVVFLLLLINDFQKNTLHNLTASAKAIEMSIVELRNDTILAAKALANNKKIVEGVISEDGKVTGSSVEDILTISGVDFITITNEAGLTIYDTNNPKLYGENLSNDKYLRRALEGVGLNTLVKESAILAPILIGKTYLPVVDDGKVIGGIIVGYVLDDQIVDAIKKKTSLEVSIFSDNVRSATTFKTGQNRMTGTVEDNPEVIKNVLKNDKSFQGIIDIFNVEHLAIYIPLKDSDKNIVGMLSVAEPSQVLIAVASGSVQSTLKILTLLILLCSIPIYFLVKRLVERQMV